MKKQADFQPLNEPVPDGLEYRQEYWDSALVMIKARERRVLFWRSAAGAFLVLLLSGAMAAHYLWSPSEGLAPATAVHVLPNQAWASNWATQPEQPALNQPGAVAALTVREAGAGATRGTATPSAAAAATFLAQALPASTPEESTAAGASSTPSTTSQALPLAAIQTQTPVTRNVNTSTVADDDSLQRFEIASAPMHSALAHAGIQPQVAPMEEQPLEDTSATRTLPMGHEQLAWMVRKPAALLPVQGGDDNSAVIARDAWSADRFVQGLPLRPLTVSVLLGNALLADYGANPQVLATNPSVGLVGEYNHNRTWSALVGLEYFNVGRMDRSMSTFVEVADVIAHTTTTQVHTERLHYASLPVSLGLRFGQGHQLTWTAGLSCLLQASQRVEISQDNTFTRNLVESRPDKGYLDGFRTWNTYVAMGYSYNLSHRLAAGVRFQYGLNDITRDDFQLFDAHGDDRNSRMLGYVRMNIW